MRNITLTDEALKQLQKLKRKTEDKDEAAVIGRALGIYDALTDQVIAGGEIFIRKADGSVMEAPIF